MTRDHLIDRRSALIGGTALLGVTAPLKLLKA